MKMIRSLFASKVTDMKVHFRVVGNEKACLVQGGRDASAYTVRRVVNDRTGEFYELQEHPAWLYPSEWFDRIDERD